jgi:hypothetical protein
MRPTQLLSTLASAADPSTYARRVLLAVSGLTPQILTETLCTLACDEDTAFITTEVHLITSAEGARRASPEPQARSRPVAGLGALTLERQPTRSASERGSVAQAAVFGLLTW